MHCRLVAATVVAMARNLGPMTAELTEAERAKFTAPLVLVHGLWDDPKSWRRFMGFLSHRGWRCIAVGWQDEQRSSLDSRQDALQRAVEQLEDRPVLIGHDLGGLQAMRVPQLRAAVAIAPLVSSSGRALGDSGTWMQRLRATAREPGRKLAADYPAGRHIEPLSVLAELEAATREAPTEAAVPRLMIAGADDRLAPPDAVRPLAAGYGAELEIVAGRHALHLEDGWEAPASIIHKWLIRNLGEELLALYEEAWADREPES